MSEAAEAKTGFDPAVPPTGRRLLLGGGHLAALWALAFVQPLLDLLGKNPDFFVARGNTVGDILIVAIGFTVVPPLVLLLVEWLVSKVDSRAYYGLHFVLMTVIAGFFFVPIIGDLVQATPVVIVVSLVLAAMLAWAVFSFSFFRNLMDILIIAPLAILVLFIFASKSTGVIFPSGEKFTLAKDSGTDNPLVMIVFDELGTVHLMTNRRSVDAGRYPNFARLSREGTWYKNHTTTADMTPIAVPEILTGVDAPGDTLPTWRDRPRSVFSQFTRNRPLNVKEPVTALCPEQICSKADAHPGQSTRLEALWSDLKYVEGRLILPPRVANTLPNVSSNFANFGDSPGNGDNRPAADTPGPKKKKNRGLFVKKQKKRNPNQFDRAIQGIPDSDRGFTVLHMEIPHETWKYDTEGQEYNSTPLKHLADGGKMWRTNGNGIAVQQSQMYAQTGFADRIVGEMRARLRKLGLWDKAMVIVTADHGISFAGGDIPQRQLDDRAMGEVANPPLFIKYPGQREGGVSLKHSTVLDIVPTIARALGVHDLYESDGLPLQDPVPDRLVRLKDKQGEQFAKDISEVVKQRNAALAVADKRLGTGPFYTLGPASRLVGRPAPPVPSGSGRATLDSPDLWDNYQPDRKTVPIFITGTTDVPVPADPDKAPIFAMAVNGVVQGTGRIFDFDGATRFGALVSPDSLRWGRNEIGIYQVEGDRLIPLGGN